MGGGHQASMGRGVISQVWVGGSSAKYGKGGHQPAMGKGVINQLWVGGHQPTMGEAVISQVWVGGSLTNYGEASTIKQQWGWGVYFPTSMYRNSK